MPEAPVYVTASRCYYSRSGIEHMANDKLRIATRNEALGPKPAARKPQKTSSSRDTLPDPTPDEGRRLMAAFLRIRDPNRRAWLAEQVERIADLKSEMR
jgi:hypothetical protein